MEQKDILKLFGLDHSKAKQSRRKPWTLEEIKQEALKYDTRLDFSKGSNGAYNSMHNRFKEHVDELCSHMIIMQTPAGYWTYEKCKEEISNIVNIREVSMTLRSAIQRNGWYDALLKPLMLRSNEQFGTKNTCWTKEAIWELAKEYNYKVDFSKNHTGAYLFASRRGWLEEVCSHMKSKLGVAKLGQCKWTKELIKKEALKFKTRSEFAHGGKIGSKKRNYKAKYAHGIAGKNGWLDEVCSHMKPNINDNPRYIYAIIWENEKTAYIGLTQSYKDRFRAHKYNEDGAVYKTIQKYGNPKFKVLTPTPVNVKNAAAAEERWKLKYEKMGYTSINISPTGSLGSYSRLWDYESVKKEALKYDKRSDFMKNSGGAYSSAKTHGWLNDVQSHMPIIVGRWDIFEHVEREAKKYRIRKEFSRGCRSASEGAYRNGWMDILFPKENLKPGDMGYWNIKENVKKAALECNSISEFDKNYRGAYNSSRRNGWLDELSSHMVNYYGPRKE